MKQKIHHFIAKQIPGFTLIELLAVISIILVLAGLIIGISGYANRMAVEANIKAQIKSLEVAIETYKGDFGVYPCGPGTPQYSDPTCNLTFTVGKTNVLAIYQSFQNITNLYKCLAGTNNQTQYYHFPASMIRTNAPNMQSAYILDPLGNMYGYNPSHHVPGGNTVDPIINRQTFDLWSMGIDSINGYVTDPTQASKTYNATNDDIGNWKRFK